MKFIVTICISLLIKVVCGQVNSIGLKLSPSLSFYNQKIASFENESTKLTYSIGLQYQRKISEKLSLIGELNYDYQVMTMSATTATVTNPNAGSSILYFHFRYLELPVLLRYSIIGNHHILYTNLGLSNAYKLRVNQSMEGLDNLGDIDLYFSKYYPSILFGIGSNIDLNAKLSVTLEARYRYGLTNQRTSQNSSVNSNGVYMNMGLNYKF